MQSTQSYRSWVEVDLDNFANNWKEIRRIVGPEVKVLQVVKADAYGHGSIEIAKVALENGAYCLGVANADEGVQLRISGISAPILILSPSPGGEIREIIKYNLTPSISDISFARDLQKACAKAGMCIPVHVEVDTGMGRGGILYSEALKVIREIASMPNLTLEGIFTHLSCSEIRAEYNVYQWELFRRVLKELEANNINVPIKHMSNSGAILNYPEFNLDMVRPGLMSYGIYPSLETRERAQLHPVMVFKTRIVLIKDFPKGYSIGYNRTYITEKPSRIATIPVGYGDGYGVILSNAGEVLIRGKRAPVVGRVSMDMCTVDVSHIPGCAVGDEVVLMGSQGDETISAYDIANRVKTITYEILCTLGKRAPRVFIQRGKTNAVLPRLRRIYVPDEERSVARINSIIRMCLQARVRNEELGDAIYYEMLETLFGKEDRSLELRENFRYYIKVCDLIDEDDPLARGGYLQFTTIIEYRKVLRNERFIIGCALNREQLASFFEDPRCEYRWLLDERDVGVNVKNNFRVSSVIVDNIAVPIIRKSCTDRGLEIECGAEELKNKINQLVKFSIEIVALKSKSDNMFSVYLVYPTRGLEIVFDHEGSSLRNVREVSFFAGKRPYPEVTKLPNKSIRIYIPDDNWIFPNSGVTFVWEV
ncbi:MAG: alanine racemase [Syntrophales bacterium]|nr:alanine racemase [Syntrophales bacterium]